MLTIHLLQDCPGCLPGLVQIWYEGLGKVWAPELTLREVQEKFSTHLNRDCLPLALVARWQNVPIGMVCLRETDGLEVNEARTDPLEDPAAFTSVAWLGSLVVAPDYQKQGIAAQLIEQAKIKARLMNFKALYLFTFNPRLPGYYARLGWSEVGPYFFKDRLVTVMKITL